MSQLNEDIQFLIELQKELKYQSEHDNDYQAAPRFWTIGDFKMFPVPFGFEDDITFNLPRRDIYGWAMSDFLSEMKEEIEFDDEFSKEAVAEFVNIYEDSNNDPEAILSWIHSHYDSEAYIVPIRKEHIIKEDTMFLTKAEAKRHIELNHYHYTPEAHTYAMTAWRAPQVERLWKILENFDWSKIEVK